MDIERRIHQREKESNFNGRVIKLWKSAKKATLGAEKDAKNKGEREKTKI